MKLLRRLISFFLALLLIVPTWAVVKTWYAATHETIRKADAIVVMGAAQLDGRAGEVLTGRLTEAKRIFDRDFAPRIFTLGAGAPGDRFTEAGAGKTWLISNGVSAKKVISIPSGRDSYASIEAFASKVGSNKTISSIIIVTDPYHCLRSTTMARDKGFSATCSPSRTGKGSLESAGIRYLIREAGAYLAYVTLGRHGIHISDHVA